MLTIKLFKFLFSAARFIGDLVRNLMLILKSIFSGQIPWSDFIYQSSYLIFNVISPVFIIAIALGIVIGIQLGPEFVSRGLGNQLGILSALTMTRELIPVVGSMMIATQYGTGIAAEIANMKITEQVDALKVFKVSPIYYLAVPRFLAAVLFCPVIIWLGSIVAVTSSYLTVWLKEGLSFQGFLGSIWSYFKVDDIMLCIYKAAIFGAIIVLTAVTLGFQAKGGAKEVGNATTQTVILSFILIVLADYFITALYL